MWIKWMLTLLASSIVSLGAADPVDARVRVRATPRGVAVRGVPGGGVVVRTNGAGTGRVWTDNGRVTVTPNRVKVSGPNGTIRVRR